MAQRLDFSPLDQRAQIYRDKARRDEMNIRAAEQIGKGVLDIVDWQQDMKQKFAEASQFDSDITMDAQANSYLANKYDKMLKQPHIEAIMGKRWKNQDHINQMLASQKQLQREAANVKGMVQARNKAEQEYLKNPTLYKVDTEAMKEFDQFLMGNTDVQNANAFLMKLQRTDGVPPFLDIREHDVDAAVNESAMSLRDKYSTVREEAITEVDQGVSTSRADRIKKIDALAKKNFSEMVYLDIIGRNKSMLPGLGKSASNKLRDENISSTGVRDDLEAYVMKQFDYSPYFQERVVSEKVTTKPVKDDNDKGSASTKKISQLIDKDGKPMETKFGLTSGNFVDYSTQPPSINELENFILPKTAEEFIVGERTASGDIKTEGVKDKTPRRQSAKGIGTPQTYRILGHDKDNGQFWLVERRGRKQQEVDEFGEKLPAEYLDHVITVPEEEVLSAYGVEYTPKERKKEEVKTEERIPEFKTNPKKIGKASNEDMEAIDWARANPTDPRAKVIFEELKSRGFIE
jgi:hypothetical protein